MAQWLSWLERRPVTAEVESSSLFWVVSIKLMIFSKMHKVWDLSSAGRASALQAEGHRFEPYRSHQYGWIPEWPKGADCKSVGNAFEGSNPSPSTYADVAQLAEQLICNQQVIGSSPIIGLKIYNIAGWSSLEARRAHNPKVIGSNPIPATYAQIAQLVEQRTENPRVAGSIPALGILS